MQSNTSEPERGLPSGILGLFERPGVYFLTFDLKGRIVDSNSSWEVRFGDSVSRGELPMLASFATDDSRAVIEDIFQRLRSGETATNVDLHLVPTDGEPFQAGGMISPVLEEEKVASAFGVLRERAPSDFTERSQSRADFDPRLVEALAEFAPAGMMMTNAEREIIAWNRNFLEFWGLDASVIRSGHALSAAARIVDDPASFHSTIEELSTTREGISNGSLCLTDGRVLDWFSTSTWNQQGEFVGRAWYYTDSTARTYAEELHRRSEELYRRLTASFPDGGVFIFSSSYQFVLADGEVLSQFGLSKASTEGRNIARVLPSRVFQQIKPLLAAALKGERRCEDIRFYDRTFAVTTIPLEFYGRARGSHGMIVAQDVTRQRETEERLRGAEARLRTLVEQIPAITYVQQVDSGVNTTIYISPQVEKVFGYAPSDLVDGSIDWLETVHPDDRAIVRAGTEVSNDGRSEFAMEYRVLTRDGDVRCVRDEAAIVLDDNGVSCFWQGILTDITEERRLEQALVESEALFRSAFDDAPIGVVLIDIDGTIKRVNGAFCELLGYTEDELFQPQAISSRTHPADIEEDRRKFRRLLAGEVDSYRSEKRFIHKDGRIVLTQLDVSIVSAGESEPKYVVAQVQDITERQRLEEDLRRSESIFRSAFDYAAIGMARVAPDGSWLDANAALCRMFGYTREELLQTDFQALTHPEDLEQDLELVRDLLEESIDSYRLEKRYFHKNGSIVWGDLSVSVVRDGHAEPLFFISQIQDITQQKHLEERMEHLALHDELTGLLNRSGLSRAIGTNHPEGVDDLVGVLMLDLDGFKTINDAYGHAMGDLVLCETAARIRSRLREDDVVARVGGDEFVVILAAPIDKHHAEQVARRVREAVERPIRLSSDGPDVGVGLSIGLQIGLFGEIESDLIVEADRAMYVEKRERKLASAAP